MSDIAKITAKILIDTESVLFRPEDPFVLTSGKKSPIYVDCRKLIAFPAERQQLMKMGGDVLKSAGIADSFDVVAGGETAGIPYSAWIADVLNKPMAYVRKKPKGFGRGARIEGNISQGDNVLLVEDMTTDGGSKVSFVEGIRQAGAKCNHCFVVFSYGIFPDKIKKLEEEVDLKLHYLASFWDVLEYAKKINYFKTEQDLKSVEDFINDPEKWQQEK
ncbi:MAG: orotate phosphoribosyltransferase [Alphaproteobacteria bacterium]|nr:orotate phosphoribosyltransferase [Alphaproteobacteria bacterium]